MSLHRILQEVSTYLNTYEIISLLKCNNKSLNVQLSQCKYLKLTHGDTPNYLLHLHISSVAISDMQIHDLKNISSITELILNNGLYTTVTFPPNLTSLTINCGVSDMTNLELLPKSITKLKIYTYSYHGKLPNQLISLEIHGFCNIIEEFPPDLESLHMLYLEQSSISKLTKLKNAAISANNINNLPDNITSLHILPLRTLGITPNFKRFINLKSLNIGHHYMNISDIPAIISNLTISCINKHGCNCACDDDILHLSNLTTLNIVSCTCNPNNINIYKKLPKSITILSVNRQLFNKLEYDYLKEQLPNLKYIGIHDRPLDIFTADTFKSAILDKTIFTGDFVTFHPYYYSYCSNAYTRNSDYHSSENDHVDYVYRQFLQNTHDKLDVYIKVTKPNHEYLYKRKNKQRIMVQKYISTPKHKILKSHR